MKPFHAVDPKPKNTGSQIYSILARPRFLLNPLMLLVFAAAWVRDLVFWLPTDAFGTTLNYWAYTDWLIDYSQGFIRRGLSGALWGLVPPSIPPLAVTAVFSWLLILLAAFGYLRLLARSWKAFHPLILFGLLFLPSLFFFYLHDHNAIARKEVLGYISVLLHLLILEKCLPVVKSAEMEAGSRRSYLIRLAPLAGLLLPAVILVHEGNFLLFVPLHALITLSVLRLERGRNYARDVLMTALMYLPAALAFGAVFLSGTPDHTTLLALCEKWLHAGALQESSCVLPPNRLSGSTLPGSFNPMEWPLAKAAGFTFMVIGMNWIAWLLVLPALGVSVWYLGRQGLYAVLRRHSRPTFSPLAARACVGQIFRKYFPLPFLFSLPVYLTAYDYGRWFTIACVNFALLTVSINLPLREYTRMAQGVGDEVPAESAPDHLDSRPVFYIVSAVICILALVVILPHYCLLSCEIFRSPLEFFSHTFSPH